MVAQSLLQLCAEKVLKVAKWAFSKRWRSVVQIGGSGKVRRAW